jgi:hypothetical protein
VYDAALEPDRWPDALRCIGAAMSEASGILAVHPWSGGVQWAMISDLDPKSMPTYEDDFSSNETNPYFQVCRRVPLGEPIAAETFTAPQEFEETDFYRAILSPQRLRDSVIVTLAAGRTSASPRPHFCARRRPARSLMGNSSSSASSRHTSRGRSSSRCASSTSESCALGPTSTLCFAAASRGEGGSRIA